AATAEAALASAMQPIIDFLHEDSAVAEVVPEVHPGGPYSGTAGAPVGFDGSASKPSSSPTTTESIASYAWDLNGDGVFDDATGPTPNHVYSSGYHGLIGLQVTD